MKPICILFINKTVRLTFNRAHNLFFYYHYYCVQFAIIFSDSTIEIISLRPIQQYSLTCDYYSKQVYDDKRLEFLEDH